MTFQASLKSIIPQIDTQRCTRHVVQRRTTHSIKISWHFADPQDLRQRWKESNSRRGQSYSIRFLRLHRRSRNQMCGKLRILAGHLETRFARLSAPVREFARSRLRINARHPPQNIFTGRADTLFARPRLGGENRDTHVCAVTRELEGRKSILENDNSLARRATYRMNLCTVRNFLARY